MMHEGFDVRPLGPETWPAFEQMMRDHDGVWGGCWCLAFHAGTKKVGVQTERCALKKQMVAEGQTHSALVFDGATCVGFAQYGSPAELPEIKNKKRYQEGDHRLPDWRITCHFVAKSHRKRGVMRRAAEGAVELIAKAGGGIVEVYPEKTANRKASSSFLWGGTAELYESLGFTYDRQIGKHAWVLCRDVSKME